MAKIQLMEKSVTLNEDGRRIGESHPRAKLSDNDVDDIRDMFDRGVSTHQIAARFQLHERYVRKLCDFKARNQVMVSDKKRRG